MLNQKYGIQKGQRILMIVPSTPDILLEFLYFMQIYYTR